MSLDVVLASCTALPRDDEDLPLLLAAFRAAGVSVGVLGWDDPRADFTAATLTLIRSTWNYSQRLPDFLAWIERVAARSTLWNGRDTVRWNAHKGYLFDLEARGVPVVPTHLVRRGDTETLGDVTGARGWSDVVVKPAVSAGSRATVRVTPNTIDAGEAHFRSLIAREDVLVQPYMASIEGSGERSIVWIDGATTHAVRKTPRFQGDLQSVSDAVPIEEDEAELAQRAVAAAPGPLLYARVDIVRDAGGAARLMELELVEPSLFFRQWPEALTRYVAAATRLLARR